MSRDFHVDYVAPQRRQEDQNEQPRYLTVETTKKSAATMWPTCARRNVRHD